MHRVTIHLVDCVAARAHNRPNDLAVIHARGTTSFAWSWRKLWREAERIAALLLDLQVCPGEVVAYQLPNCAEFVAITLAVLRVGAVCCPLMPMYREREVARALERSRARLLFVMGAAGKRRPVDEIATFAHRLRELEHLIVIGGRDRAAALPETSHLTSCWLEQRLATVETDARALESRSVSSQARAQLLFTSGTSGMPKGVMHRHDTLMEAVELAARHLGLTDRDRLFVPSPLAHQTGFLYGMWLALRLGAAQVLQSVWEPHQALATMREWRATFVQAATPFLADLVQAVADGGEPPRSLRLFIATGATVPRSLARRATDVLRTAVCGAFGTTESCLATLSAPDDPPEKAWGSDGRALASVHIRVCDEAGEPVPAGTEGHLQVRSPTMFEGYLDDPELTADAYTPDGWYRTGDLAMIDAEGFLHVTGRVKDVINRGGEKIPVAEIEQLLHEHEAVREAAIVAIPDARLGERACAFVAPQAGRSFDFPTMCGFLDARRVAKPYWPERLELIAELPRTASGKVQKFILRERARSLAAQSAEVAGSSRVAL